jgi:hypothetical protein
VVAVTSEVRYAEQVHKGEHPVTRIWTARYGSEGLKFYVRCATCGVESEDQAIDRENVPREALRELYGAAMETAGALDECLDL